jgi:2-polyprenyl-3-methyl-5-hydroxy-6-metoxy-1,4-benzoquinol methylase
MDKQPLLSEISRRRKLNFITNYLQPNALILEVGAGTGWFSKRLKDRGFQVVSLDLKGPADIVGDIKHWRDLKLRPQSFDAVVALEVIEHVDCLDSLCSLCKQSGLIMLSSPHPQWDWVMKILEHFRLTQMRTSEHINLTDFKSIRLPVVLLKRPMWIHQVAIFRNDHCAQVNKMVNSGG